MPEFTHRFLKIFILCLLLSGFAGAIVHHTHAFFHHAHALGDVSHSEASCNFCVTYQAIAGGIVPTGAILAVALVLVIRLVCVHYNRISLPSRHFVLHSALDPPFTV